LSDATSIEERISRHYAGLSDKLQVTADYVAENPIDIATRSLRSLATTSGVSPATFSRLARAIGYEDYQEMREEARLAMGRKLEWFSQRAEALRSSACPLDAKTHLHKQAAACITNIETLERDLNDDVLENAVEMLHNAKRVLLVGSLGSSGFIDYFGYLASWFKSEWLIAGRNGTGLAATIARLGKDDAVLAIAKAPYARRTISSLKAAKAKGVPLVVLTDSHASPALELADHGFVVPIESPQFFSSYAATVVFIEAIVTMLLARSGDGVEDMIRETERQIHALGETWTP